MDLQINLKPMFEWQKQCFAEFETAIAEGKRLLVLNTGRRSGKSDFLTRFCILSERGVRNGGHWAYCGPSEEHVAEPRSWVRHWFAELIVGPNPQGDGFSFSTGGSISFVSLSGGKIAALRGREMNGVAIDEAGWIKSNLINLLEANISPTLSLSRGPIILASTPKGIGNDYWLLWNRAGKEGARFTGTSRMNPGFSQKEWEYRQRTLPPLVFDQEMNAQFVDATGGLLTRSEVKYAELPKREDLVTVVFGIDPAVSERSTADRTAVCVAAVDRQDRRFVAALYAWRLDWPTSMQKIIGLYEAWRPNIVVVEEVSFQKLVVQQLADFMPVKPIRPEADKITRWEAIHTYYHCGEIYHATDLDVDAENEIFGFPVANHDDVPDAVTYAVAELFTVVKRAWVGRNDAPGFFRGNLPHERVVPKLYYDDGSYMQNVVSESGETVLERFNPDASVFDDTWRIERVGDQCIVYEHDQEISRHPRWHEPTLRAQHREEYEKRYAGRTNK
jgi:predicted phage terminase large subunit-like protein